MDCADATALAPPTHTVQWIYFIFTSEHDLSAICLWHLSMEISIGASIVPLSNMRIDTMLVLTRHVIKKLEPQDR